MRPPVIDGGRPSPMEMVPQEMEAMMLMPGAQRRDDPGAVRPPPGREEEPPATVRGEYVREAMRGKGRPNVRLGYRAGVGF
jgi:hypothetical protein